MFSDFIIIFEKEKTKICCCLKLLFFKQISKRAQIEKICNNNEKISSGYLFNKTNIFDNIEDIKEFIINTKNENKKHKKLIILKQLIMIIKYFLMKKLKILKN